MIKKDVYKLIAKKTGVSVAGAKHITDIVFDTIQTDLVNGETIQIWGFGQFYTINKKERIGRCPLTKAEHVITARRIVRFRPGINLKKKLNKDR